MKDTINLNSAIYIKEKKKHNLEKRNNMLLKKKKSISQRNKFQVICVNWTVFGRSYLISGSFWQR